MSNSNPTLAAQTNDTNAKALAQKRVKGRRSRFYVFTTTALAVFLLSAVIWPLRVRQFSSKSVLKLEVDKSLAIDQAKLKSSLVASLGRMTSDEGIDNAVKFVGYDTSIQSPVLAANDRSMLRDKLNVQLHETSRPTELQLSIEMVGYGTPDEIKLVNHLAAKLITELTQDTIRYSTSRKQGEIKQKLAQFAEQIHGDQQAILKQLQQDCQRIGVSIDDAIAFCQRNGTASSNNQNLPSKTAMTEEQSRNMVSADLIRKKIAALRRDERSLLEVSKLSEFHPQITTVRRDIEILQNQLNALEAKRKTVVNKYVPASSIKTIESSSEQDLLQVASQLKGIDVDQTVNKITRLVQSLDASKTRHIGVMNEIDSISDATTAKRPAVTLTSLDLARSSQPVGGVPSLGQLFLLLMSSLLLATAVSTVFNPSMSYRPFASSDHITEKTGLPVIGAIPAHDHLIQKTSAPKGQKLVIAFVRLCELFLILSALILIFSAMLKTGFLPSLFENPFHAAAKLFRG
jgi:hypothetical protein